MTPKEKAIELVRKMYVVCSNSASDITLYFAKQCALKVVDEIMKIGWNLPHYGNQEGLNYWYQVKQEIEKL
jgi:hypothetical protein